MAAILHTTLWDSQILKWIFSNGIVRTLIQISMKIKRPINKKSPLVQVMASCLFGAKTLPEPMMIQFTDAYVYGRHQATMS